MQVLPDAVRRSTGADHPFWLQSGQMAALDVTERPAQRVLSRKTDRFCVDSGLNPCVQSGATGGVCAHGRALARQFTTGQKIRSKNATEESKQVKLSK
jgi:hypothetical protein